MSVLNRNLNMADPPHPGRVLRQMYLEPLEMTARELAERLGVSRSSASQLVNERGRITPAMAWRLAVLWGTSVRYWSGMQEEYDLWHARQALDLSSVRPYEPKSGQ